LRASTARYLRNTGRWHSKLSFNTVAAISFAVVLSMLSRVSATLNKQLVIVEFPSMERAREWYGSPEYAEALKIRAKALTRTLLFVDGVLPET
jgi:hypothetical protein